MYNGFMQGFSVHFIVTQLIEVDQYCLLMTN